MLWHRLSAIARDVPDVASFNTLLSRRGKLLKVASFLLLSPPLPVLLDLTLVQEMHLTNLVFVDVPVLLLATAITRMSLFSLHPVIAFVTNFRAEVDNVTNSIVSIARVFGSRLLDVILVVLFVFVELAAIVLLNPRS